MKVPGFFRRSFHLFISDLPSEWGKKSISQFHFSMYLLSGTNIFITGKRLQMKKLLCLLMLFSLTAFAQDENVVPERKGYWSASLGYTYDFLVEGYVYVKEVNSVADSLSFNQDLNLSHWHNAALKLKYTFKNDAGLTFSVERFFFTETHKVKENIYYNDLVINGSAGISLKETQMYRGMLLFEKPVTRRGSCIRASLEGGLMYDYIHLKITGQIINEGDSLNFKEDFNDQVIPAPVLGAKGEWFIGSGDRSIIVLEAKGTYVSQWLEIYNYEHTAVNVELGYRYNARCFFISPKLIYRHLHSREDESQHVFDISTLGANMEVGVKF